MLMNNTVIPRAGLNAMRRKTLLQKGGNTAAGFTMIEVLIALVVLSLGLLGLAGLQVATTEFNHSAYLRSQATRLAYSMADRMRANRQVALESTAYATAFTSAASACGVTGGSTMAEKDISAWRSSLACALPLGNGQIEIVGDLVTISVRWDDSRGEDDAEIFEMTTGL